VAQFADFYAPLPLGFLPDTLIGAGGEINPKND